MKTRKKRISRWSRWSRLVRAQGSGTHGTIETNRTDSFVPTAWAVEYCRKSSEADAERGVGLGINDWRIWDLDHRNRRLHAWRLPNGASPIGLVKPAEESASDDHASDPNHG
jgi:hypothetical protein